jgi:anthranilate synthase component 2
MILVIDNYDSFTHNLVHLIGGLGAEVLVRRNDALGVEDALSAGAQAIVLTPGPRTPNEAGVCLELVKAAADARLPVFGVCLGMQAIAQAFGGEIVRAKRLMHGKTCEIVHKGGELFAGLPSPFIATRYHSLALAEATTPSCLKVTARAGDDDEIMAVAHDRLPIAGVQFHPESIASEYGTEVMSNFFKWAIR